MSGKMERNKKTRFLTYRRAAVCLYICAIASALIVLCLGCQPIEIGQPGAMSESGIPVTKSGQIVKDEIWAGLIIIESDVIIPSGVTLTIDNGTKVKFYKDTKLLIHGSLYIEGQANRAVTLTSAEQEPKAGDWDGIVFSESSLNSKVEFCVIDFHKQVVCLTDSLRINDSVIAEGSIAGILCELGSPTFEDNMITKNEVGIRCDGSSSPIISHNAITANFTDGIECKGSAFPTISYNVISTNYKHGVSCYSASSPSIEYNNIIRNSGWGVYDGGKMVSNFVQGNNEQPMSAVDTSTSPYGDQYYGVESVESPRSARIEDAGVRKKERW